MFDEIGKKIMKLAQVLAVLNIIASVILALAAVGSSGFIGFVVIAIIGTFSVISCWPLYGFGQLVDDIHRGKESPKEEKPLEIADIPEL